MSTKREVVETWFRRVWKEEDTNAIDELFVVDGHARGLGENILVGPKDFKVFHAALCALLCDIEITVDMSIEQDDWISSICTFKAKDQKTGNPVVMTGNAVVRIADGKIAEAYNHWDFQGLYSQLGLLPVRSFDRCLAGESFA